MEQDTVGFVGVGRMGGPMASRLLDAGYSLCVFDTNPDAWQPLAARGARVAASPAEVGSSTKIVLMSLPTPPIVQAVALGEQGRCRGSSARIVLDLSTSGPGMAAIIAHGLSAHGMTLVDSPVSGGVAGAIAGTLAVMVSCPEAAFGEVEPILKNFG